MKNSSKECYQDGSKQEKISKKTYLDVPNEGMTHRDDIKVLKKIAATNYSRLDTDPVAMEPRIGGLLVLPSAGPAFYTNTN